MSESKSPKQAPGPGPEKGEPPHPRPTHLLKAGEPPAGRAPDTAFDLTPSRPVARPPEPARASPRPSAPPPPKAPPAATPGVHRAPVILGVTPGVPEGGDDDERPDPKKLLQSTASALGRLLSPVKQRIAHAMAKEEAHAPPPPEVKAEEPAPAAEPAAPAEEPPEEAGSSAPTAPALSAPKPTAAYGKPVTLDRIVLLVGPGEAKKANIVLARKGIKDAKSEGDRFEFSLASNRVSQLLKAILEQHVEIWGLERTSEAPRPPP